MRKGTDLLVPKGVLDECDEESLCVGGFYS